MSIGDVFFVIPNVAFGGAERVTLSLLQHPPALNIAQQYENEFRKVLACD